ncbi:MAG: lipocalin-like domain-containing protein, partial [Acidobacteriota bacterium]
LGGSASCSAPNEPFSFKCGPDSLSGSVDVLPLSVVVDDGDNMQIDLELTCQDSLQAAKSFFLEGKPVNGPCGGGKGWTSILTPGIYYSWPQLQVSGTVSVNGKTLTVKGGSAWMDHQLTMSSLKNPGGKVDPIPFIDEPSPYNGWTWQFFNLDSGDAFTCASFMVSSLLVKQKVPYGYYLTIENGAWSACYITSGMIKLSQFKNFPVVIANSAPKFAHAVAPTHRLYDNIENVILGDPLGGLATPWSGDGTFVDGNLSISSEMPSNYTDTTGKHASGGGYCELVGFEPVPSYRQRALAFLKSGRLP